MYFEITVTRNCVPFFSTGNSITSRAAYDYTIMILKEKFQESEGYKVSGKLWEKYGTEL